MMRMSDFTVDYLKNTTLYKELVNGFVSLIHNVYYDSKGSEPVYIVIHSNAGKWTVTRFFRIGGDKLHASNDYVEISTNELMQKLLSNYSRGLA